MLATLIIEFGLAIYSFLRYKMNVVSRLAIAILVALGSFQLAEYMICGGLGLTNIDWARFGYVSITLLPALGIHMLTALNGQKKTQLVSAAYATCAAFVIYYIFNTAAIGGQACYANYAVFHTTSAGSLLYAAYYYGWLIVGVYLAWYWGNKNPEKRTSLHAMMLGYLAFIVPTSFFNIIDPRTVSGIPSIMCGFAVLLAFVIAFIVLPNGVKSVNDNKSVFGKDIFAR